MCLWWVDLDEYNRSSIVVYCRSRHTLFPTGTGNLEAYQKHSFQKNPRPDNFENQLGMDWSLPKNIGYPSDTAAII